MSKKLVPTGLVKKRSGLLAGRIDLFMFIWYAGISFFLQALQIVGRRVMMIILGGPKTDRSCPHVLRVEKKLAAAECEIGVSNWENMKILTFHPHQNSIHSKLRFLPNF